MIDHPKYNYFRRDERPSRFFFYSPLSGGQIFVNRLRPLSKKEIENMQMRFPSGNFAYAESVQS